MPFPRSSGILLHPTSFPGQYGIGDLGAEAYRFVDFLAESSQQFWQVLPLGPTGYGNSPYMCYSAVAGNPLLISPQRLYKDGLLIDEDFATLPAFPEQMVDYDLVIQTKMPLLEKAWERFPTNASKELQWEFQEFCDRKAYWLNDYALFMSLKDAFEGDSWHNWKPSISKRKPEAIQKWERRLAYEISYQKFLQFEFFRQWTELKKYANSKGIQIIGDIPIYVSHDSADVWANPEIFCLDEQTGVPALMAGVPPDYFSETGQLWGNPVYNWEYLQNTEFKWWIHRFEALLDYVDVIRIDHFRGFEAYWAVPQGEQTAMNGTWMQAPGEELFKQLRHQLGKLPILAEDLGVITPEVEALRDQFEFPGMKIIHFAFGSDPGNSYLPYNYPNNCVVYTGTHDNDTTVGWFEKLSDHEKDYLWRYLGRIGEAGIHWDLLRLALSSVANQALIPLQDLLGLGSEARMNRPGVGEGNWGWRYLPNALTSEITYRLRRMTEIYNRTPK